MYEHRAIVNASKLTTEATGCMVRPGNVQVFHLTLKQFTQYLQILVFQLLDRAEQFCNFLAVDFRLIPNTAAVSRVYISTWNFRLSKLLMHNAGYLTSSKTFHMSSVEAKLH